MRILIKFSYNGTNYSGYQKQNNAKSIQQVIEEGLESKLNQKIKLVATGRTDAKVHALCQYAHFDADINFDAEKIVKIAKFVLPEDIKVYSAKSVSDSFDARKDVKRKTYMYVFNKQPKSIPFLKDLTTFLEYQVDTKKIEQAKDLLIGEHNFKAFCASKTETLTFVRTIYNIEIKNTEDYLIFKITGNGFLYNMVRIIVGTLVDIGRGNIPIENIDKMLNTGDRKFGGKTAKPNGLYLYDVEY